MKKPARRIQKDQQGRPSVGQARALDEPRQRRNAAALHTPQFEEPLYLTPQGRVGMLFEGPLFRTPSGELAVRVSDGVGITTGSPRRLVALVGQGLQIKSGAIEPRLSDSLRIDEDSGAMIARPTAAQVAADSEITGVSGSTVEDMIARLQINKENTIDHDADVTALGAMISIVTHRITFCLNESQINAGAEDFLIGSAGTVVGHRMDSASFARLLVTIREPTGAIKPDVSFWLRYYVSFSDVVGDYIPIGLGGTEVTVTISTTGSWSFGDSGWVPLEVFGADFLYLAIISKDEDSSSAPCDIGNVTVLLSKTDG